MDVRRHPTTAEAVRRLRDRGFRLAAAVPGAGVTLAELDLTAPTALWFGNEHDGLTAEAQEAADVRFGLVMEGMTRSLNLSVAVAIGVFAAAARRRAQLGAPGDLPHEMRERLRARWYFEDVRGADAVLRRAGLG
jgi:tRNA (guanosine-2'-O-)-methyltransferase